MIYKLFATYCNIRGNPYIKLIKGVTVQESHDFDQTQKHHLEHTAEFKGELWSEGLQILEKQPNPNTVLFGGGGGASF